MCERNDRRLFLLREEQRFVSKTTSPQEVICRGRKVLLRTHWLLASKLGCIRKEWDQLAFAFDFSSVIVCFPKMFSEESSNGRKVRCGIVSDLKTSEKKPI
jgi:hypothetical protein